MVHALRIGLVVGVVTAVPNPTARAGSSSPCEALAGLTVPDTAVTSVERDPSLDTCRVKLVSRPTADSEIRIEVWLPAPARWNGKMLGTGNGGYSGDVSYAAMRSAISLGYATAGSDTGHQGGDLRFGLGHPEKINDWGYRAVHVMTEVAKLVIRNYYGRFARLAYFSGCSTGGHQALTEAQRHPGDYDGIVAGAPGNNRVRLNIGFLWSWLATHGGQNPPFPASKLPMLNQAVVAACDGLDGARDGVIGDPRRCRFDPSSLLCKGDDAATCLTAPEVSAVRSVYAGARNPLTGERLFAGWVRGSEAGWASYFVGHPEPARLDFWRYWVFHNPEWDPDTFDFDRDVAFADTEMAVVSANDPNLRAFKDRKGKLILYHGWADPVVPPDDTIRYFENVEKTMGGASSTGDFVRLFLVPGMGHCGGGPGPTTFDVLSALDAWVSDGIAPETIAASHLENGSVAYTRPLCRFPQVARPKSPGNAEVFVCAAETGGRNKK
jgi:feruloyl esterase